MAAENGTPKGKGQPDTRRRRPKPGVTIDLEAQAAPESPQPADESAASGAKTEAAGDPDPDAGDENRPGSEGSGGGGAPAPPLSASPEPAGRRAGIAALVIAGIVGAVVALALGYGLQATGVLPAPGQADAQQALAQADALEDSVAAFDQRLTSIEASSAQSIADRALLDDLSRQVRTLDSLSESLSDRLLTVEASIAELKDAAGGNDDVEQTLNALAERVTRLEAMSPPDADDDGTQQQLESLSKRVARLEAAPPPSAGDAGAAIPTPAPGSAETPAAADAAAADATPASRAAATPPSASDGTPTRAAVLSAFRRAAGQGGSFAAELDEIGKLGVAPATIAELEPLAEKGAPSRAELVVAFPKVADAILAAEPATDEEAGFLDRLTSYGRSLVTVRPAGTDDGGGTEAVVARMRAAVTAGDLETALTERDALPAEGRAASQKWADAVADRLEIDRLSGEIAAAADAGGGSG